MKKINLLVLAMALIFVPSLVLASASEGVIDASYRYAWSDKIGQIDMSGVKVLDGQLKGTATTAALGIINFDDVSFKVSNDGAGNLSGSAYGQLTGLINFAGVKIGADGYFSGIADGSFSAGKIYFDCTGNSACPNNSSAKVMTDWRPVASRQQAVVATTITKAAETKNYSACDGLNDYLSYSRCVSEVDAKRSQTTVLASEEPKSVDGEYSIKINDGAALTNKTLLTLNLTAPKEAVDMIIASDNNFGFGSKQKVAATATWSINDEQGVQSVYVKFYNQSGMPLKIVAASVTLDKRQGDAAAEKEAKTAFKMMYGRVPGTSAVDAEALRIMAYGMNVTVPRDLAKEKIALARFIKVYMHAPIVDQEWNMIKAYTYAETIVNTKASVTPATTAPVTPTTSATVSTPSTAATVTAKDCRLKTKLISNLDIGSKGKEVIVLQESLKCQGMLAENYKVAGNYDSDTELAVAAFQKQNKILCKDKTYCGAIGPATRDKLNNLPAPKVEVVKSEVKATVVAKAVLTRDLTLDVQGDDVTQLQTFLARDKAIYPEGLITGKFGPMTEAAVKRLQAKYGLKCSDGTACGYIGPASRKKINELMVQ